MKLKDLFIVQEEDDSVDRGGKLYDFSAEMQDATPPLQLTPDNFIAAAYGSVLDTGANIAKALEIKESLPSTVTDADKKTMVKNTLPVFGMPVEEVIKDGEAKIAAIKTTLDELAGEYQGCIDLNNQSIEDHQTAIKNLSDENKSLQEKLALCSSRAQAEIKLISDTVQFLQ